MSEPLIIAVEGHTWSFTLNRPDKRNALSAQLVDALIDGVALAHRQDAKLLVFRGAGANFSSGFDFSEIESLTDGDLLLRFVRIQLLLDKVASSPAMTLALAHGKNFGAGVDLFAACRKRIAAADASFRMPGLKFGLVLGSRRFAEIVGRDRALAILEQALTFDAAEALAMGFVDRSVEAAEWHASMADALTKVSTLDDPTRAALFGVLRAEQPDTDLAVLVRSAARPGLKERIQRYLRGD